MVWGMFSRSGILVLFGTLCSSGLGNAQSQACADSTSPLSVTVKKTKITIVGLEFNGENPLSDAHACDWAFPKPEEHRVPNRTRMPDRENIPQTICRTICQI